MLQGTLGLQHLQNYHATDFALGSCFPVLGRHVASDGLPAGRTVGKNLLTAVQLQCKKLQAAAWWHSATSRRAKEFLPGDSYEGLF